MIGLKLYKLSGCHLEVNTILTRRAVSPVTELKQACAHSMGYIERKCVVVHSQRSGSSRTDSVPSAFPAPPLSRHVGSQTLHALGLAGAHIPKSRHSAPESNGVHSRQSSGVPWAPPAGPGDNTALCPPRLRVQATCHRPQSGAKILSPRKGTPLLPRGAFVGANHAVRP